VLERAYSLSQEERSRLAEAVRAAFAVPFLADVEGYIWEAVFHYVKGLAMPDPVLVGRRKLLFDAVSDDGRGWSLKTLLWRHLGVGASYEFVVQRADIFKKAAYFGFPAGLDAQSSPADLGCALIRHWNQKFEQDSIRQGVTDPRVSMLLKSLARDRFTYVEYAYPPLDEDEFEWRWTDSNHVGLQGFHGGKVRVKWYHGQKQMFEVQQVPESAFFFEVEWDRCEAGLFCSTMLGLAPPAGGAPKLL